LLAADGSNRPLQAADAGFARVMANDEADRLLRKLDLLAGYSVFLNLPRNQVLESNVYLLFLGVALELDDLHAVAQRVGYGIQHVCRGDEQHLRQIKRHIEVVIAEAEVLLGIERLQQRRSRVAPEV